MKWKPINTGFQLPSKVVYGAKHVNILRNMLERHVKIPHRLVCVTDDAEGIDQRIEVIPIWNKCRELGGCYNRLWVFSKEAGELFGPRFCCIDLDCVILKDCTAMFSRREPFIMNAYNSRDKRSPDQHYNGSLIMMDAGARSSVWDEFDPAVSPAIAQADPHTIGTDQAWIRHHLGKGEARFTERDGVFEARHVKSLPLPNVRMVFFSGPRDPVTLKHPWIIKHWR